MSSLVFLLLVRDVMKSMGVPTFDIEPHFRHFESAYKRLYETGDEMTARDMIRDAVNNALKANASPAKEATHG